MNEQLDRAARASTDFAPADQCALPAQWWIRDGADLGPLRLVYNPDDVREG